MGAIILRSNCGRPPPVAERSWLERDRLSPSGRGKAGGGKRDRGEAGNVGDHCSGQRSLVEEYGKLRRGRLVFNSRWSESSSSSRRRRVRFTRARAGGPQLTCGGVPLCGGRRENPRRCGP